MLEWWRQKQNKTKSQLCKNTEMLFIAHSLVWFMFGVWSLLRTLLIFGMWSSMLHWAWAREPGYGDKAAPLPSPLFFSSKWFVPVSMREQFWGHTYIFGLWYGMRANCPPVQTRGLINPGASIGVLGIWIMSHESVPARREDIGDCSLTTRHGLFWICVQCRENAATTGTLNSFRKCGRDI